MICDAGAKLIGVCNGRVANNLPSEEEVVQFYNLKGIKMMRIYDPNEATLHALMGTNIQLILGVPNEDLASLVDPLAASCWISQNVIAFSPQVKFKYIAVGNEVKPLDANAQFVLPAMQNIYNALVSANLQTQIKVSTAVDATLLGSSFPPSSGAFSESSSSYITPIVQFLANVKAPFLANVYPYFSYVGDPVNIRLDYTLFTVPDGESVVKDGSLSYYNMFDAMLDAFYSALDKVGGSSVEIVVSESGWPSAGGFAATVSNAGTYYKNLIEHVDKGTPKRPGKAIETYLFALFDENQKGPAETEQHFGLFSPDKQAKYENIIFN